MTMHTPGPWVIHPTAHHPAVRSVGTADVGPKRICTVGTMTGSKVDIANATLIAAAPELLTWATWASKRLPDSAKDSWQFEQLIATIQKAGGEA